MFRIVCDPSSGSMKMYLTEIIRSGSYMFVVCLVGVWQLNFEPVVCVCVRSVGPYTHTHHPFKIWLRIISVKYSSIFPDDGSHTIRNMLK